MTVDVCLVSGRRPDLLQKTLASFESRLLRNFAIERFIVNIDPVFGGEAEHRQCVEVIHRYASSALVIEPKEPNFCKAVRTVWLASKADVILHLEDDWLLNRAVTQDQIADFERDASLGQISFNTKEKNWDGSKRGRYHCAKRKIRVLGARTPLTRKIARFTTSPSFLRGSFARRSAALMDVGLGPEKQFYTEINPKLEAFVSGYRNYVIGDAPHFWISDIGRDWRAQRGIQKRVLDNKPVWVSAQ